MMIEAGTPFPRHRQSRRPSLFFIHFDVIEIIAADVARGNVDPADLESLDDRRFARQQDALNVSRDLEVMIEPLLFVRFRINDGVVERESRLLGDRFEDDEIARA